MFTDRDMDDLDLAAQEREAERELVDAVMKAYESGSLLVTIPVRDRCRSLAAIKARRAALLDGGGGREGESDVSMP